MHVIKTLPKDIAVALSGGVDSVSLLHYLKKKHNVTALHYVHNSENSNQEYEFVNKLCNDWDVPLVVQFQQKENYAGFSKESYWRDGRYKFFKSFQDQVCTGHNLSDAVEWYLMTCLRGEGHYMDYQNENVVKPFLLMTKKNILSYAEKHQLKWFEDETNSDVNFTQRNKVRHEILPKCLEINPGLYKTVATRISEKVHS